MTAEEMKLSMYRTRIQNRSWTVIPTHYIVWSDWSFVKVNELDKVVWGTRNADANWNWIHIEVVWNFNEQTPTQWQYDMVKQLIKRIEEKHPGIQIKWHKDFANRTCPWKNFDFNMIITKEEKPINTNTFEVTRYYSPVKGQSKYYNWKTYEQDVCMNCWCWGDCSYPANGIKLTNEQAWKVVACSQNYMLRTKFNIEWYWWVTCVDRWSAIQSNRLDLWMWYGEEALNKINTLKRPAWTIKVLEIKKP